MTNRKKRLMKGINSLAKQIHLHEEINLLRLVPREELPQHHHKLHAVQ